MWPENWPIVQLFFSMSTQWRIGMSGETGLIYEALYPLLDRRYQGEEWDQAFSDLQEMERSALDAMRDED